MSIIIIIIIIYFFRVFHISISWWFFTGIISLPLSAGGPALDLWQQISRFIIPLGIVPSAPITIGITVTFIFYGFFRSLARSRYYLSFIIIIIIGGVLTA